MSEFYALEKIAKPAARSYALEKIAKLAFRDARADEITVACADQVAHGRDGVATVDWLVDLAKVDEVGTTDLRGLREVLPFSSGVPVLPGQSVQLVARPQVDLLCKRFLVSFASSPNGAADWIIEDIRINARSQFIQPGALPGDMFASDAIDAYMTFHTLALANMDITVVATYVGTITEGVPFFGSMVGLRYERHSALTRLNHLGEQSTTATRIPAGFALVSVAYQAGGRRPVKIYMPPIDRATIDVAVDAVLAAGAPTEAVHAMIDDMLDHRTAPAHAAYVALVEQLAAQLAAEEKGASA